MDEFTEASLASAILEVVAENLLHNTLTLFHVINRINMLQLAGEVFRTGSLEEVNTDASIGNREAVGMLCTTTSTSSPTSATIPTTEELGWAIPPIATIK